MTCLLTEVGKTLMDSSNKTKQTKKATHTHKKKTPPQNNQTHTHLLKSILYTSLHVSAKRTDVEKSSLIHFFNET